MRLALVAVSLSVVLAAGVSAHHSPTMFDMKKRVKLTGVVREFQWTNPHSYIQLMVKDGRGQAVEWSLEMAGPTYLYNNGWRPSTLKPGQSVTVTMSPLVSGAHGGLVWDVVTSDGRKLGGSGK